MNKYIFFIFINDENIYVGLEQFNEVVEKIISDAEVRQIEQKKQNTNMFNYR